MLSASPADTVHSFSPLLTKLYALPKLDGCRKVLLTETCQSKRAKSKEYLAGRLNCVRPSSVADPTPIRSPVDVLIVNQTLFATATTS